MLARFQRSRRRFARPVRSRRNRDTTVGITPERLEQRIALDAAAARDLLQQASTLVMDQSMGPSPVVMTMQQVAGTDVKSFVISHVPEGSVVEKWDTASSTWVDVSTEPTSGNPLELMRRLANRVIHQGDRIQWRPQAGAAGVTQQAFQMINWDDGSELLGASAEAPSAVQNLKVNPTGVGELTVTWEAPATGDATSYSVTITTKAGTGRTSTTHVTSDTEYTFSELSPANGYSFSVTASNSEGTSSSEKDSFRQAPIFVRGFPQALTTGLDGSIWVASLASMTVQQIVNDNGVWKAQAAIDVGRQPQALTTGLDGSIWVANYRSNTVQQIVEDNGVWTAQAAIDINRPTALTTGLDGSIWVANFKPGSVQQIVNDSGVWTAQEAIDIDFDGSYLTTGLDGSIWVAGTYATLFNKNGYVQQITKDNGVWTAQGKIEVGGSGMHTGWIHGLTTGLDGSIWVAFQASNISRDSQGLQQVVNDNGAWTAQGPIELAANVNASAITTGLDGSIWGAGFTSDANYVQQFVKDNGVWTEQPGIAVGLNGYSLTTGLDGSIWVTNSSSVQQIVVQPSAPVALAAAFGPAPGEMTLAWQPPIINGGTPAFSYTATVFQGNYTQTITTSETSCVFEGLTLGSGPTYFTVTATNFAGVGKPAGLQIDAYGNPIPKQFHRGIGITADGVPATDGGFDGFGNTYSWEAMSDTSAGGALVGTSLVWGGLSVDVSPNQPDFTIAAGQDIEPTGSGSVLTLLGARLSELDAIGHQTFTLNFDDGTTESWIQFFSDWCQWQYQDNESILSTQSYRNTASGGTDDTTNYIYSYGYTLPEGKTLESITLPNNSLYNIFSAVLSEPTAVDLDWNAYGLDASQGQVPNSQGFDGNGNYYNANYYNPGGYGGILGLETASNSDQDTDKWDYRTITWGGATFNLGPAPNKYSVSNNRDGNDNFLQAKGQVMNLTSGDYSQLVMIGAGANGNQADQVFTLKFTDGSTATWTQSFTDWRNNAPTDNPPPSGTELASTGEAVVAATNVINQVGNQAGSGSNPARAYVYGYSYDIPAGKTLESITLPNNSHVGILGMALV